MKYWIELNSCGGSKVWNFLSFEDRIMLPLALRLPGHLIFHGIVTAWKQANRALCWRGTKQGSDLLLSHCCWWIMLPRETTNLVEKYSTQVKKLVKKGLRTWGDLWNPKMHEWYLAEVLRQKWKIIEAEMPLIVKRLSVLPKEPRTGIRLTRGGPIKEWGSVDGTALKDTTARCYNLFAT